MDRVTLVHLSIVGPDVEPAIIEFNPGLTIIHGASETGKSYIAGAIDFMLGSRTAPKEIVEARGYSTVLLGLAIGEQSTFTLSRPVDGGNFSVYDIDLRSFTQIEPSRILSAQHSDKNNDNLSNFLLESLGLASQRLKKNQKNQTVSLSMRNLLPYCVVDETSMQAERSPILTGQYVTQTPEIATFKLLLEGVDDSMLVESEPEESASGRGKLEIVEQLISETERELRDAADRIDLTAQLARIVESLQSNVRRAGELELERDSALQARRDAQNHAIQTNARLSELANLLGRFNLLRQKYESDIARLEMIDEAGALFGYFTPGVCVFCGAAPEHQRVSPTHSHADATDIAASVEAESRRTELLLSDLLVTLTDLRSEADSVGASRTDAIARRRLFEDRVTELDDQLAPVNTEVLELLEVRSSVESLLGHYSQMERFIDLRTALLVDSGTKTKAPRPSSGPTDMALRDFSRLVSALLLAWQLPESSPVHFDRQSSDIIVAGRARPNRGKGMRSILHAAFKIAVANYCTQNSLPHPGFIVLDSPLVTYREPYGPAQEDDIASEAVSGYVADGFFRYLASEFAGQTVVLENVDPPDDVAEKGATAIRFTKSSEGRYGFFPTDEQVTDPSPPV